MTRFFTPTLLAAAFLLCAPLASQDKPQVVVVMEPLAGSPNVTNLNKDQVRGAMVGFLTRSGRYTVVDRRRVDQVLEELNLQWVSGVIDPNTAKEFGKQLSADYICTTELTKEEGHTNINVMLINVTSGVVEEAGSDTVVGDSPTVIRALTEKLASEITSIRTDQKVAVGVPERMPAKETPQRNVAPDTTGDMAERETAPIAQERKPTQDAPRRNITPKKREATPKMPEREPVREAPYRKIAFGLHAGVGIPMGDFGGRDYPAESSPVAQSEGFDNGFGGRFTLTFPLPFRQLGFRAGVGFMSNVGSNTAPGYQDIDLTYTATGVSGELQVFFDESYRHRGTYIFGGATLNNDAFGWSRGNYSEAFSKVRFGGTLGLGHTFTAHGGKVGGLTLELAFHTTFTGTGSAGDPVGADYLRLSAGYVF
jgi:hypothetical protein